MIRRLLAGRYLILSEIGAGGMGTVYRARDQATQRLVAIKVLHPHLRREASYVQRLRREAQIALTLDSRHIVQVIDYGQEGDAFYLVMEYVEGVNLRELLRRGKLEGATAVRIAAHIARALEEAHEKRIVHRDIKPQNVIVGPHGDAKVADFGIARVEGLTTLTDTGSLIGSAHYMAPETFRGHGDRRSDLYSLGAVLYEMLTGRVPFPGETPFDVVRAQLEDEAPPLRELLPDIDEELASLVGSLLAKDPSRRPGTAQEARAVLERLLAEQDTRRLGVRRGRIGSLFAFASRPFAAAGRGASRLAQPRYALAIAFLVGTVAVAVTGAVLLTGASGNGGDTAVQPSPTPTVGPISTCEIDAPLPLAAVAGACAGAAIEFHRDCPRGYACAVRRQAGALVLEANDRTIAFIDDGGNLAVARENGSEVVRLTAHGRASEPAWSPDGRYLVYVYTETAPEDPSRNLYQLRIIDVDNPTLDGILLASATQPNPQDRSRRIAWPQWWPDGTSIYFQWREPGAPGGRLFSVDVPRRDRGVDFSQLATDASSLASLRRPVWLLDPTAADLGFPNGYLGGFAVPADGEFVVQYCDAPGEQRRCGLARWDGFRLQPVIDPAAGFVFASPVISAGTGPAAVYGYALRSPGADTLIRVDANGPADVSPIPREIAAPAGVPARFAVSPDGTRLLLQTSAQPPALSMVDLRSGASESWQAGSSPAWYQARAEVRSAPQPSRRIFQGPSATPSPEPSPTAEQLPRPMTLNIEVRRRDGRPVGGAAVAALSGGTTCAQGSTDASGRLVLEYPAAASPTVCYTHNSVVTFTVNGASIQYQVIYSPQALISPVLFID